MLNQPIICRFAPSPTGFLHVGNIRAAIVNFLFTKKNNGQFFLRFDDTDVTRSSDEYRKQIIKDLDWLNIKYDQEIYQSKRLDIYQKYIKELIATKRLYACFETNEELELQRKLQAKQGVPPIYDRACLHLTDEQKENYLKAGRKPYYRFLLKDQETSWNDLVKGKISFKGRHFSDPVVIRDNGSPTYTFCSVIDDIDFKISHIIRGEDHITNTAIQIQIFQSLNANLPEFAHLALIKNSNGKISKRIGGFDIKSLKESGFENLAIINLLSQVGTSKSLQIYPDIEKLITNFNLSNFSKSTTNYDLGELENINQKLLQVIDYDKIKFSEFTSKVISKELWNALSPNISKANEINQWLEIIDDNFTNNNQSCDQQFLENCAELLPEDLNADNSFDLWLTQIKESNPERKGKNLFMPIRLALTNLEHGPELKTLFKILPRKEIIRRLLLFVN